MSSVATNRKTFFSALLILACLFLFSATGETSEAIDPFNQNLLKNAHTAIARKNDDQARGFLSKFLESYPQNSEALLALAHLFVRQGRYIDADVAFSRLLRLSPDDADILFEFGINKWRVQQGYEAQEALFQAKSSGKLTEEQQAAAENALVAIYKNWNVFRVMKEHNDDAAQERFFTYQIAEKPDDAVAYALRGFLRNKRKSPDEAAQDFTKALEIGGMKDELTAGVQRSLAAIERERERKRLAALWIEVRMQIQELEAAGDRNGLEQFFTELIERGDLLGFALYRRGYVRLAKGDLAGAEQDLTASLETDLGEKDKAHILRALDKISLQREKTLATPKVTTQKTVSSYLLSYAWKKIQTFLKKYPKLRRFVNKFVARTGQYGKADVEFSRLLAESPHDPDLLYEAGLNKWHLEEGYEAQSMLAEAIASKKLDAERTARAREALGKIYDNWDVFTAMKEHEDFAAQKRFHTHQINKKPDEASVSYALRGFLRRKDKELEPAKRDFEKALAIGGMNESLTDAVKQSLEGVKKQIANEKNKASRKKKGDKKKGDKKKGGKSSGKRYIGVWDYFKRATALMDQEKYEQAAQVLHKARNLPTKPEERGIMHWYLGEVAWRQGNEEAASKSFERALPFLKTPFYRSGALTRLAAYTAQTGDMDRAEKYAVEAARIYPEPWRLAQISAIFAKAKMPAKAIQCFETALEAEWDPVKRAVIYKNLAGLYDSMQNTEMYRASLREYLKLAGENKERLAAEEQAQVLYYEGELLYSEGKTEEAFLKYKEALLLLDKRDTSGGSYLKLANRMADAGYAEAAEYSAEKFVSLSPEDSKRYTQAAQIFQRTNNFDKALHYTRRAFDLSENPTPEQARSLAYMYLKNKDRESFKQYHYRYIDALYAQKDALGDAAPRELIQKIWDARRAQTAAERRWGFNSYNFGSMKQNGDRYSGFVNEVYTNYTIPGINLKAKFYAQFNGTYDSYSSGTWRSAMWNLSGEWEARTKIEDSLHAVAGVKVYPFSFVPQWGFAAEYVFPIGVKQHRDFRLRTSYYRTWGGNPQPFGWNWLYASMGADLQYSTRVNDFKAMGSSRLGRTFCFDFDRNLLVYPFAQASWTKNGMDVKKAKRWGLQAGPGIGFKKFLIEDKYHAPLLSVEFSIGYLYGLSHDMEDGWSFNLNFSF